MTRRLLLLILLSIGFQAMAEQPVKILRMGSYAQILEQHHKQSFMLVFWSLDCPPCYKELAMLGDLLTQQPKLALVVISTDSPDNMDEIKTRLKEFKLNHVNAWVFDNGIAQQLRYEIDPNWYGELPRSYLFNARHQRRAVTGVLNPVALKQWKAQ
ncbi:MAG: redoxin domain-containing protein [Gammaproteobacteria bacterium]|nr:redoxin domain-containing protein [Gammaproteobacteria bacterium]MDH5593138.1 redoxin domain-containing protein [Gammaproteobacteria bacterium]MDH5614824.1 redoxin domain-containing protein [Gammaproteobacteria bacterium]